MAKTPSKKKSPTKAKARPPVAARKNTAAKPVAKKISKPVDSTAKVLEGRLIPAFSILSTGGKTLLSKMLRGKWVVLYFYPRDATPGCTTEGHDFTRLHSQFKKMGCDVFGVSRDSIRSHEKFKETEKYSIDLLSDEDEALCTLFGVIKMKNMYGKQVRGIERSTFLVDPRGLLIKEWRGVKVPGHADEVLNVLRSLKAAV